ncbi:MAG TPA: SprB repeat-containing protein, partial [Bacteroidia bacterium]|nr:SprB repeat-containing protein [Bacteroidia bacterium]
FQIKLHESTNIIEILSISLVTDGGLHTQGIENASGSVAFVPGGRNSASFSSTSETVTFTPVDATAPSISCPANISLPCAGVATFANASGSDNCSLARVAHAGGLTSGSTFPVGSNTVTFRARDHGAGGVFANGAGGSFTFNEGDSPQTIALKACESVYGAGNCVVGSCGNFTYYYRTGHFSCNCSKTPGQYEFVFSNPGYTNVGQDYGGTNAPVTINNVPFVRVKGNGGCSVPNTWFLANDQLGGNSTDCSFQVNVSNGPTVNAGPDLTICGGGSTTLQASGNATSYSWTPSGGLSNPNILNPVAAPGSTTTYTLTGVVPNGAGQISYNQSFLTGVTPTSQASAWCSFRSQLLSSYNYTSLVVRGSQNTTGLTLSDPVAVAGIANAMRTATAYSVVSGGNTWSVSTGCVAGSSPCAGSPGVVLHVNGASCSCDGAGPFVVRPEINNLNWGGLGTGTCSNFSQTMEVTFSYGNNCTNSDVMTVTVAPPVTASVGVTNVTCNGGSNGVVSANASGGNAPYTYAWSTGHNTAVVTGRPAGTYTVTVTSANGCTAVAFGTVSQPPAISLSASASNQSCPGSCNGSINLNVSGGTPSATQPNASGLASSLVLWTDANDGVLRDASGGVLQWSDISGASNNISQGSAGNRPALVSGVINGNPVLRFNTSQFMTSAASFGTPYTIFTITKMNGGANARLISSASTNWLMGNWGGYQNVMYANGWVTPSSGPAPDNQPHMYHATGTGGLTTLYDFSTTIASNAGGVSGFGQLQLNGWSNGLNEMSNADVAEVIVYNRVLNANELTGVRNYLASKYALAGSAGPAYTYLWSNGATVEDPGSLCAGTYTVTVTDANGCQATTSVVV